jgi:hypothetical protein
MEIAPEDLWVMFLSTIRYSMGRRTYMSGYCEMMYKSYSKYLNKEQKVQIAHEIRLEVERCELSKKTLGGEVDHRYWKNLWHQIEREVQESP